MKGALTIAALTLLLVSCSPTDTCRTHTDESSCVAENTCVWTSNNNCRTPKKEKNSPQSEKTTTSAPTEQVSPPTGPKPTPEEPGAAPTTAPAEEPNPAASSGNYSSPSTDTQPQPTYPEGELQ
jgi:hypothetical protein